MEQRGLGELLIRYKAYIAAIVVLLAAIIVLVGGCGKDKDKDKEAASDNALEQSETEDEVLAEESVKENNLEENSHASIDRLITKFMDCLMSGDLEVMEEITDYLSEDDRRVITANSLAYESYTDLKCYTKNGPKEDSYIVYVTCDIKITGVDTPAPYTITLYLPPKENGSRYIRFEDVEDDEELQAYVAELEKDPEVQALYADVNARYQAALESDKKLYDFIQNVSGKAKEQEEPAEEPAEEPSEEPEEEEPAEEPAEEPEQPSEAMAQNRQTRVKETANVRAQASTDSERLALAYQGEAITEIESYADGWSKVEFNGKTGYMKTEFLE